MTVEEKREKVLDLLNSGPEWFDGALHCSCIIGATAEILGLEIDHNNYQIIPLTASDVVTELELISKNLLLCGEIINLRGPKGARKAAQLLKDSFLPVPDNLTPEQSADSRPEQDTQKRITQWIDKDDDKIGSVPNKSLASIFS